MEDKSLERRVIEEDMVCDYCDRVIKAGSEVFVKTYFDVDGFNEIILCSPNCLDEYETEEFLNSEEYKKGII